MLQAGLSVSKGGTHLQAGTAHLFIAWVWVRWLRAIALRRRGVRLTWGWDHSKAWRLEGGNSDDKVSITSR